MSQSLERLADVLFMRLEEDDDGRLSGHMKIELPREDEFPVLPMWLRVIGTIGFRHGDLYGVVCRGPGRLGLATITSWSGVLVVIFDRGRWADKHWSAVATGVECEKDLLKILGSSMRVMFRQGKSYGKWEYIPDDSAVDG